jgi:undecaprenyl-diphosphatase
MEQTLQAIVMGIVQGLTEFLPISSSGHLIIVPYLLGWNDPFLQSLAFSVVISAGTLAALLVYFRHDWARLIPAGLATIRDRSFQGDPDRRLAWLIAVATIPAAIAGFLFNDVFEQAVRQAGLVAIMLLVGAAILWLADRWGSKRRDLDELGFPAAIAIGAAQALALIPGVSRSGVSISAGLFAGLTREGAARFSFLMATPITALAVGYETVKLIRGDVAGVAAVPLIAGTIAAFISGMLAIAILLRFVRTHSYGIFVAYRIVVAAIVIVVFLVR